MQLTKFLEGTAVIEAKEIRKFPTGKEVNLEYYLLEVDGYSFEEERQRVYGVQIVKTELDEASKINTETELIPDLSTNKENVKEILRKLIEHRVTPVGLYNVLEDIIGVH